MEMETEISNEVQVERFNNRERPQKRDFNERVKKKTIHLCAPWPVNEDSCIYGIDLYEYDESSHEWHRRFFVEFEKEYQRNGFGCVFVNNKLYLLGGEQCTLNMERLRILYYDEMESYDINTGTKDILPVIPNGGRTWFWTIAIGKFIYIFGGERNNAELTDECNRFDMELRSWKTLHPMPVECSRFSGPNSVRELNGLIYIACGLYVECLLIYDPSNDSWSKVELPSTLLRNPLLFKSEGWLYVVNSGVFDRYDPTKNTWTKIKVKADDDDTDVFLDALEVEYEIFACTLKSREAFSHGFGKLKFEYEVCTLLSIDDKLPIPCACAGCFFFVI